MFLVESFPNRDKRYFDWWLKQYSCEKNLLNRTFLVEDKGKIIACTTANWNEIKIHGKKQDFYWEGNTIVLKAYRGKGVGRMIYEQMGRFSDRCVVGLTDAAYNIQPKIIPCFRPINPVYVYLSVNRFFLNSLYRRCLHYRRGIEDMFYPLKMAVRGMMFYRIDKLEQMSFTSDGFWQNDDIEIINEEWLERMVGHAELEHVGAVGAKLLYPNSKKIQHIGVINIANGPVHAFIGYNDDNIYYFGRNKIDYNWLVVTAACMLVNAAKFNKVNGFNEDMPVAYNDVELCFRLVEAGYYNVVRNDVILYHHESVSRGNDLKSEKKFKRLMAEQKHLYKLHPYFKNKDPFYSSNLTQHAPDFSYNMMKENIGKCVVEECTKEFDICRKVVNAIDNIYVGNKCIIEGWGFYNEKPYNGNIQLLLKSDNKSYLITTRKIFRSDLAIHFKRKPGAELSGFICEFDKIDAGKYQIYVCCNGKATKTKRHIIINK